MVFPSVERDCVLRFRLRIFDPLERAETYSRDCVFVVNEWRDFLPCERVDDMFWIMQEAVRGRREFQELRVVLLPVGTEIRTLATGRPRGAWEGKKC